MFFSIRSPKMSTNTKRKREEGEKKREEETLISEQCVQRKHISEFRSNPCPWAAGATALGGCLSILGSVTKRITTW